MKHTDIRAAVLDALEQHEHGATLFDGRPVVFDEEDFPAIAVYLTDAEYTGEELDADTWRATLHIEVFLPAQVPDSCSKDGSCDSCANTMCGGKAFAEEKKQA